MALEEFEIDGKKVLVDNEVSEDETGVVSLKKNNQNEEQDLEKTHEINITLEEILLDKTLTNIFGDQNHE